MSRYSVKNTTKNLYVKQVSRFAPVKLVPKEDRTIFYEEFEAEALQAELDDTEEDCYTVIAE